MKEVIKQYSIKIPVIVANEIKIEAIRQGKKWNEYLVEVLENRNKDELLKKR